MKENGALLRSKAGDKSTSLGIIPRFSKEYMPSAISFSVMGGGSAKGSSLNCFGKIRLAFFTFSAHRYPIPSFSSSMLLMPPWALPYLNWLGGAIPNFCLIKSWPLQFSGSLVKKAYFCSLICFYIDLFIMLKGGGEDI